MRIEPEIREIEETSRRGREKRTEKETNTGSLKIVINVYFKGKGRTCSRSNNQ